MENNLIQSSLLKSYIDSNPGQNAVSAQTANIMPQPSLVREPEEDVLETKNKSKKAKIAKIALLSATGLTLVLGGAAAFRHKGGLLKTIKQTGKNITGFFGKNTEKAKDLAEKSEDLAKGADNIANVKDSVTRHFLRKLPFFDRFDNFTSGLYRKTIGKTLTGKYKKAQNAFSAADDALKEALKTEGGLDEGSLSRLQELVSKKKSAISSFTSEEQIKTRFKTLDDTMADLDGDAWKKLKGLLKKKDLKEGVRNLSTESVVKGRLEESREIQKGLLKGAERGGLTKEEADELTGLLSKLKGDKGKAVREQFKDADKLYKNAFTKEKEDLFLKLRDINCGSAPSDIVSMLGTLGLLGVYTAQADTKEERVGVSLTTGIPLATTLATTLVATCKMVSGMKALLLGGITGFGANLIGGAINKKYQKAHNTEEAPKTIITLDDYANTVKEDVKIRLNI